MQKKVIEIRNLTLRPDDPEDRLYDKIRREGVSAAPEEIRIVKKSLDARDKNAIRFLYTVHVDKASVSGDNIRRRSDKVSETEETVYEVPEQGSGQLREQPVIVGAGPAGLFAALLLAEAGFRPLLIDRGYAVEKRTRDVEHFWESGSLDPNSNVSFGEGGAGTFSDGKLNTGVKDKLGRMQYVLDTFVSCGAAEEIAYWYKPHVGSDVLPKVVQNLRNRILSAGARIQYGTRLEEIHVKDGRVVSISAARDSGRYQIPCSVLVLAIGHSARDTFSMLNSRLVLTPKSFAVGFRVEHPQEMIQRAQYGVGLSDRRLPAADYKLTHQASTGRGVYSFCMCPGGQVVNASTEPEMLAVNGMSLSSRSGRNANSAIITTVTPEDFGGAGPLAGLEFQRRLERAAYGAGSGAVPAQRKQDFADGIPTTQFSAVLPDIRGAYAPADLRGILPEVLNVSILEGMEAFGRKIKGFDMGDAVFSGVESRTSSPIRIRRDDNTESAEIQGLYPCGEGAGYAGGITSAAMDGMRVAEEIIRRYGNDY